MTTRTSTPTTPPQSQAGLLSVHSTPIHTRSTTTHRYGNNLEYDNREKVLSRFAEEMHHFFVGPIPAKGFLDKFLPTSPQQSPFKKGMFKSFSRVQSDRETGWYQPFVEMMSSHVPSLTIVNTSNAKDSAPHFPFGLRLDCSVYANPGCGGKEKGLDFSRVEFLIEFKKGSDPFVDDEPKSEEFGTNPFLCPPGPNRKHLGQLAVYATAVLSVQYRTHLFMVFIAVDYARLIRWDRCGALVTAEIPFDDDPYLLDFFTRYNFATPEARGHDGTVGLPTEDEVESAKSVVPEFGGATSLLAVGHSESDNRYIIHAPKIKPFIPVGRWTRASIAFDVKKNRQVYLKDTWRVALNDFQQEGCIYSLLHKAKVPNIPSVLWHGDIGNDSDKFHQTQTDKVIDELILKQRCCAGVLVPHQHYRIVLGDVGTDLENFESTKELVRAMRDALEAHEAAYRAGILHRDVSPGNILMKGPKAGRGGMLIDWDLSKVINPDDAHSTARWHTRTGTWQFMAADLVANPNTHQTFVHDLESFFWVLLWVVVTRVKTSWDDIQLSDIVDRTMSSKVYAGCGTRSKIMFITSNELTTTSFEIPKNPTLRDFLAELKTVLAIRHEDRPQKMPNSFRAAHSDEMFEILMKEYNKGMNDLKNHDKILSLFNEALSDIRAWPNRDKSSGQPLVASSSAIFMSHSGRKWLREPDWKEDKPGMGKSIKRG